MKKVILIYFLTSSLFCFTDIFSADASDDNKIFNAYDISYFQLAQALQKCGDSSSSFRTLNFIIVQRESDQICDQLYLDTLYEAMSVYPPYERERVNELMTRSQIQNNSAPTSKIENGYLIIENIPQEMLDGKNCDWIQEILIIFGMEVAPSDIQFKGNSFSVKLPSSCCCCRNLPTEASSDSE